MQPFFFQVHGWYASERMTGRQTVPLKNYQTKEVMKLKCEINHQRLG